MINKQIEIAPDEDDPKMATNGQAPPPPRRGDITDARIAQRQRMELPPKPGENGHMNHQAPPQRHAPPSRTPPPARSAPPMPVAPDPGFVRSGLIDRGTIASRYGLMFGLFGILCELNSFWTTIVGVYWLWGIMFSETKLAYFFGFIIASGIFIGEIFNSDFYEVVIQEDEDTGDEQEQLSELPGRRRNYYLWLTPDAVFTLLFWLPPFVRLFVFIFFNTQVVANDFRAVAELLGQSWSHSWSVFLVFFLLCLLPATLLASAWSVISAYYPEKALLGPRFRDQIKRRMVQLATLQGTVGM